MLIKSITHESATRPSRVDIVPSNRGGIFLIESSVSLPRPECYVGRIATIPYISEEDLAAIEEIDRSIIYKYLVPVADEPGSFIAKEVWTKEYDHDDSGSMTSQNVKISELSPQLEGVDYIDTLYSQLLRIRTALGSQ